MSDSGASRKNDSQLPPTKQMLRRVLVLFGILGIGFTGALIGRLFWLQIIHHAEYESAAIEQQVRETAVDSGRGAIYDRNGNILAMSATVDTIYLSPAEISIYKEDADLIARELSSIFGLDYNKVYDMTQDRASWYKTVARRVDQTLSDQVRAFKNYYKLKGVKIENDSKRFYPYSSLACHVIGFVGYENRGLSGIELSLDSVLTGSAGRIVRAKNALGTDMLYTKYENYQDAENGYNLTLTLDANIQFYVEKHLRQAVEDYGVEDGAAAIAMDPNTGEILALASLENFDLNNYQNVNARTLERIDAAVREQSAVPEDGEQLSALDSEQAETLRESLLKTARERQWHNNAVEDMYEPGSTFKPLTIAMALEEGVISIQTTLNCGGVYAVPGDRNEGRHCWKRQGHGMQTLTQCLQHSCNVALIQIAQKLGAEKFYDYVDAFGLRSTTGVELSGEAGSLWWDEKLFTDPNNQTQLAAASFGQTFNISPLQLIRAMSAVVNGGYLMRPYLVKEVSDREGRLVSRTEPEVIRQVISEETSAYMRGMLEAVVGDMAEGTGKNAYVAGYRIGGKTGTSTDTVHEASTGEKRYIVSFLGMAPADAPKICILVLLKSPSPDCGVAVSGGAMGAPTVGNMMADILPYLGVEPHYSQQEEENMDRTVPTLTRISVEDAKAMLSARHLGYRVIGSGDVVTLQLPAPNTVVAAHSEIVLFADSPPSADLEEMPDLTNLTYDVARQRLGWLALFCRTDSHNVNDAQSILITKQSIPAGTMVEHGTVVTLTLSNNDESTNAQF